MNESYGTKGVVSIHIIKAVDEYNYPKHISSYRLIQGMRYKFISLYSSYRDINLGDLA